MRTTRLLQYALAGTVSVASCAPSAPRPAPRPAQALASASAPACDPLAVLPPMAPGNEVATTPADDLDGDGQPAILVGTGARWDIPRTYILEPRPAPECFRVVFSEANVGTVTASTSTTHGWRDLEVEDLASCNQPMSRATCERLDLWTYDGKQYVKTKLLRLGSKSHQM